MARIKQTKWSQATLYHLRQQLTIDQIAALPPWKLPTKSQKETIGLVPIYGSELATPINNSGVWFRVRRSVRKPPTSELKRRTLQRIETLKGKGKGQVDSVKLNKTEYQGIQSEVEAQLTKETPPSHNDIDVMFHGDWFMITYANANACDMITTFLRDNLVDNFAVAVATMTGDDPLSRIGIDVLESNELIVGNIALGNQIKAKRDGVGVSVTNWDEKDSDMIELLQLSDEVQSMTVAWGAEYTAKVNSDFTFSAVKFDVETDTEGDDDMETGHLRDQDRATDFILSMPKFLKDLAVHCDGLAPLAEVSEQKVIDYQARKEQRKEATEASE